MAYLTADSTLTALVTASSITVAEVWNLPAQATYPHLAFVADEGGGAGPGEDPGSRKTMLRVWCVSQNSRIEAKMIAQRVSALLHRQQKALSNSTITVWMIKQVDQPALIRDPQTKAHIANLIFEVVAT